MPKTTKTRWARRARESRLDRLAKLILQGCPWAALPVLPDDEQSLLDVSELFEVVYGHNLFGLDHHPALETFEALSELILEESTVKPAAWWTATGERRAVVSGTLHTHPKSSLWFGMPDAYTGDAVFENEPRRPDRDYAEAVLTGQIPACRFVLLACLRHLEELLTGHRFGFWFSPRLADRRIQFNRFIHHYQGPLAGTPFEPSLWQQFDQSSVFGWVDVEFYRRFDFAYCEVGRKNGKTFSKIVDSAYLLTSDLESAPEIFFAATTRDQAGKPFEDLCHVSQVSPALSVLTEILGGRRPSRLLLADRPGKIVPLPAQGNKQDSHNASGVLADELHAWDGGKLFGVLKTATGSRKQALFNAITTAGHNDKNFGARKAQEMRRVLESMSWRKSVNRRVFSLIYCLDATNEETAKREASDPRNWLKANPNLGVSLFPKAIQSALDDALRTDASDDWRELLVKHCNVWQPSVQEFLPLSIWRASCANPGDYAAWKAEKLAEMKGELCFPAFDLAVSRDFFALSLWFPAHGVFIPEIWVPGDLRKRQDKDGAPFVDWQSAGLIRHFSSPSGSLDYEQLLEEILEILGPFTVLRLGYDPHKSGMMGDFLRGRGYETKAYRQTFEILSEPTVALKTLVKEKNVDHGHHPVLDWMVGSAAVATNSQGLIKLIKADRQVDALVALVMSIRAAGEMSEYWNQVGPGVYIL